MEPFVIPTWVLSLMPLLVIALTFLLGKVPAIAEFGKRNLGAVVAVVLAAVVLLLDPPALPVDADIMTWLTFVVGLVLYWWKGAQLIFDLITGQLAGPDGHANG